MSNNTTTWEFIFQDRSDPEFNKLYSKFNKMDKSVSKIEGNTINFGSTMDKVAKKGKRGFKDLATEIPGVGRAFQLIKNPIVMTGAAIVGIGAFMNKASKEAANFNNEFLELKNLNLNKTDQQIKNLRDDVLNLSLSKGLDPEKTSKAFFDVQSSTEKFGKEVEDIVGKVGVFARTMKADYNTSVEGAAKAMGIFQFGAKDLDQYLASNYKTVQVGITTFDQLAKVQTEYAGAAAAAGQDFDQANKLFALFTKTSKNVDIAATMTKSAFQDLTKKSTIKGFKKLGVEIFDASGNMRAFEDISRDAVPALKKLDDSQFSKLKEEIGGSEGLRGLMDQLKNSGDDVLSTFDAFNNTDFDFDKALENANGDLKVMSEIVDNKLSAAWIRFGDKITPIMISIKSWLSDMLDGVGLLLDKIQAWTDKEGYSNKKLKEGEKNLGSYTNSLFDNFNTKKDGLNKEEQLKLFNNIVTKQLAVKGANLINTNNNTIDPSSVNPFSSSQTKLDAISNKNAFKTTGSVILKQIEKLTKEGKTDVLLSKQFQDNVNKIIFGYGDNSNQQKLEDITGTGSSTSSTSNKSGLTGITGAADRVRNVTVNITNLVKDFVVNAAEGSGLSELEIAAKIEEVLIRAVRDAELTLSSD